MKKLFKIASLLSIVMVLGLLVGCSSNSKYAGRYNLQSINGDTTIVELFEYYYIDLSADGKYYEKSSIEGAITEVEGTYKVSGDKITITTKDDSQTGTLKDGKITLELDIAGTTISAVWGK